jgi:hypothetical protein
MLFSLFRLRLAATVDKHFHLSQGAVVGVGTSKFQLELGFQQHDQRVLVQTLQPKRHEVLHVKPSMENSPMWDFEIIHKVRVL